jgi:hypothetical protein
VRREQPALTGAASPIAATRRPRAKCSPPAFRATNLQPDDHEGRLDFQRDRVMDGQRKYSGISLTYPNKKRMITAMIKFSRNRSMKFGNRFTRRLLNTKIDRQFNNLMGRFVLVALPFSLTGPGAYFRSDFAGLSRMHLTRHRC